MLKHLNRRAGGNQQQLQLNQTLVELIMRKDKKKQLRRLANPKNKDTLPDHRWVLRSEAPVKEGNVVPAAEILKDKVDKACNNPTVPCKCVIPRNSRLVLQLRVRKPNKEKISWWDYVCIAWSERRQASLGVFSARLFHACTVLGCCAGDVKWRSTMAWGGSPTQKRLESSLQEGIVLSDDCALSCRSSDGHMTVIDPRPIPTLQQRQADPPAPPVDLFMGLHYINDAVENLEGDARRRNAFHQNCKIVDDGLVVATKKIPANTELLCACNRSDVEVNPAVDLVWSSNEEGEEEDSKPFARKSAPSTCQLQWLAALVSHLHFDMNFFFCIFRKYFL